LSLVRTFDASVKVDKVDLGSDGAGANKLTVDLNSVLVMSASDLFTTAAWTNVGVGPLLASGNGHQMLVEGTAADTVDLKGAWTNAGQVTHSGSTYDVYTLGGAQVLVNDLITTVHVI